MRNAFLLLLSWRPFVALTAALAILVVLSVSAFAQTTPVTRQETLRGSITPEREWWDVQHYDLAVEFMPTTRTIRGSNLITFKTLKPGQKDTPHRHTGPVFGYVLEGEYEHAINDDRVTTYKAGDTFYEPSGSVHRVARNPSAKNTTRLLAVILHPRDTKEVTVPEKGKE